MLCCAGVLQHCLPILYVYSGTCGSALATVLKAPLLPLQVCCCSTRSESARLTGTATHAYTHTHTYSLSQGTCIHPHSHKVHMQTHTLLYPYGGDKQTHNKTQVKLLFRSQPCCTLYARTPLSPPAPSRPPLPAGLKRPVFLQSTWLRSRAVPNSPIRYQFVLDLLEELTLCKCVKTHVMV